MSPSPSITPNWRPAAALSFAANPATPAPRSRLGGVVFDPVAGHLTVGGDAVTMRNRELRLLELFLNAPNQVFSKNKLADRLFSYDEDVSENAIEVYIGRLRKHLSASDPQDHHPAWPWLPAGPR